MSVRESTREGKRGKESENHVKRKGRRLMNCRGRQEPDSVESSGGG